ncbi:Tetraacyldisaccharide-1-P 4'-kinase (Lipid A 4'-kinase) (LpxK) (PDB:4EHW) [Commensalibacter communis]|uniref:tetraacyldisaccharide 4'-kinase n=1 Tax=Commensalibacter communis TaxID=2972786 RepID=UPI0022FF50DE|nr:tetraacyldisaccharide 4'-kinase [Commensalibacter communis]CAI3940322.1 Tetraacyldisaccharide-1-P 4'-kinase (Lipid A 4'-kinase) (LpxK) (PDB:4EHW) [Commensalibacter communis]
MKAPSFWQMNPPTFMAKALTPCSWITQWITAQRLSKPKWKASVPVICCGNLTVGGTGKTTVALELGKYFQQYYNIAFLTRGYKRKNKTTHPVLVDQTLHTVEDVGDEALLLARLAPTWVAANRAESAQAAIQQGAELLIMDDGFQNPTLYQDMPLLVIDGATGLGNHKALPAGPLRESLSQGLSRAKVCILIGKDQTNIREIVPKDLPLFQAFLEMDPSIQTYSGKPVIAFAGIGRPDKFFDALQDNNLHLVEKKSFPDHHFYSAAELEQLVRLKHQHKIPLVTTPKDYVRLPSSFQAHVIPLGVHLKWQDQQALPQLQRILDAMFVQGA